MVTATYSVRVTDQEDMLKLVELLCVHSDKLPPEVVEQLAKFPDICDKVKGLQEQVILFGNAVDNLEAELKRVKRENHNLSRIKQQCYKELGLSRRGHPKDGKA